MTSQVVPKPNPQTAGVATRPAFTTGMLPSILGMYAFAAATFIVAAHMAHWYGNAQSAALLFPLILFFGVAEFYAGAWAFRSGDGISGALHGTWGTFWTAFGILNLLYATGTASRPSGAFPEIGFWFIAIAAITWGVTAASGQNKGVMSLLVLLAIGSTLEAIAKLAGIAGLEMLAGYFLIASAIVAWGVATAQLVRFGKAERPHPAMPAPQSESMRAVS